MWKRIVGCWEYSRTALLLLTVVASASGQVINAVTNGASFTPSQIAPGSIVALFGTNLSSGTDQAGGFPLPGTLANTSVLINGNPAPLIYVSPVQINFQMPYSLGTANVTAVVKSGSTSSAGFPLTLRTAAPGLFLYGQGRSVAQNVSDNYSVNGPDHPAAPGSYITAYLTGQGPVDHPVPDGLPTPPSPISNATLPYSATIGETNATVVFLGLTSGFSGVLQANIQVPDLPPGDYTLIVTVGGVASNAGLLTVNGSPGTPDRPSLNPAALSPTSAIAGGPDLQLMIRGGNFVSGSQVHWTYGSTTTSLQTVFVNSTSLTATVPAALLASAGFAFIDVHNPTGSTSNAAVLLINQAAPVAAPTVSAINPTSVQSGGASFQLGVTGTNFVSGSVVQWAMVGAAQRLTTSFVSATQLTASVPANLILVPGTAVISVINPDGGTSGTASLNITAAAGTIQPTYFGFHISPTTYVGGYPWPTVSFGSMRLWDTTTKWADLNPAQGTFDFSNLDQRLAKLQAQNVADVILTFGVTPHWISSNPNNQNCAYLPQNGPGGCEPPKDLNSDGTGTDQAWKDFITALAKHLNGRIKYFELWNEPTDPQQWNGTITQLIRMAKDASAILKSVDPGAKLTTGTPVANAKFSIKDWMTQFLTGGTASFVDIVTFHGYVSPSGPEALANVVATLRQVADSNGASNLPIWDTEGSWGMNTNLPDHDLQAGYLARYYLIQAGLGIARYYWYRWDSFVWGTLWDPSLSGIQKSGVAYQQTYNWIVGAKSTGPCSATGTVWTCGFSRGSTYNALAVWDTSTTCSNGSCTSVKYTPDKTYIRFRALDGNSTTITPGSTIKIGPKPILLENQ
jgi:polysaccharide biosynthesis protein PslG